MEEVLFLKCLRFSIDVNILKDGYLAGKEE